jgi:DNA-binding response OmpR family regulator
MDPVQQSTILLVGNDASMSYLLGRFAEQSGYRLRVQGQDVAAGQLGALSPAVIILTSIDLLVRDQDLVAELAGLDTPILVCASIAEEARARGLGADGCLFHPLTLGDFQATLEAVTAPRRV